MKYSDFRRFKAHMQKAWAAEGFNVQNGLLVKELESVIHTLTIRVDPVGQIDVGMWVNPKGLPEEVTAEQFLHGVIEKGVSWTEDPEGVRRQDLPAAHVIPYPESWPSWFRRVFDSEVKPFFDRFSTAEDCARIVLEGSERYLTTCRAYRSYVGIPYNPNFVWTFYGPLKSQDEENAFFDSLPQ